MNANFCRDVLVLFGDYFGLYSVVCCFSLLLSVFDSIQVSNGNDVREEGGDDDRNRGFVFLFFVLCVVCT